jgi:hypothetical protein
LLALLYCRAKCDRPDQGPVVDAHERIVGHGEFRTGLAGMTPLDIMLVGLGGGLGSQLRWLTGRVIGEHDHGDFPVGTFLINV